MATPTAARDRRKPDGLCPSSGTCGRPKGCAHASPYKHTWDVRGDDDPNHEALLGLGLIEGQRAYSVPIHGYRAWAGWVLWFWMIDTDVVTATNEVDGAFYYTERIRR